MIAQYLLLWAVVWVSVGVAVGAHAQNRGSSFVLWFLTVLVLGLVGLLLYIAVGPDGPPLQSLADDDRAAFDREKAKRRRLLLQGPSDDEIEEWKELKRSGKE